MIITQGFGAATAITQGYIGGAVVVAVPGHHTVSDRALFDHSVSDRALYLHTVSDLESSA